MAKNLSVYDWDKEEIVDPGTYIITHVNSVSAFKGKKEVKTEQELWTGLNGGSFFFVINKRVTDLIKNGELTESEFVHLIYVGSFADSKGVLVTRGNQHFDKKTLLKRIGIAKSSDKYNFYNKMLHLELLTEIGNKLIFDNSLLFKGSPKDNNVTTADVARFYQETIQRLYEENTAKSLVPIFKLLPYINKYFNHLCHNPTELNYEESKPMTPEEVASILGIDNKNLKRSLLKTKVGSEFMFYIGQVGVDSGKITQVIINPSLVWMSSQAPSPMIIGIFNMTKAAEFKKKAKKLKEDK